MKRPWRASAPTSSARSVLVMMGKFISGPTAPPGFTNLTSTWVAHPALASIATEVFNKHMPTPNQLFVRREDVHVTANDLLNMNVPGRITEDGIRKNLNIGLGYMEAWIRGIGCVPINHLMCVTHFPMTT